MPWNRNIRNNARDKRELDRKLKEIINGRGSAPIKKDLLNNLHPTELLNLMPVVFVGTKEKVKRKEINDGRRSAVGMFFDEVVRFDGWAIEFLDALNSTGFEYLARRLIPDYRPDDDDDGDDDTDSSYAGRPIPRLSRSSFEPEHGINYRDNDDGHRDNYNRNSPSPPPPYEKVIFSPENISDHIPNIETTITRDQAGALETYNRKRSNVAYPRSNTAALSSENTAFKLANNTTLSDARLTNPTNPALSSAAASIGDCAPANSTPNEFNQFGQTFQTNALAGMFQPPVSSAMSDTDTGSNSLYESCTNASRMEPTDSSSSCSEPIDFDKFRQLNQDGNSANALEPPVSNTNGGQNIFSENCNNTTSNQPVDISSSSSSCSEPSEFDNFRNMNRYDNSQNTPTQHGESTIPYRTDPQENLIRSHNSSSLDHPSSSSSFCKEKESRNLSEVFQIPTLPDSLAEVETKNEEEVGDVITVDDLQFSDNVKERQSSVLLSTLSNKSEINNQAGDLIDFDSTKIKQPNKSDYSVGDDKKNENVDSSSDYTLTSNNQDCSTIQAAADMVECNVTHSEQVENNINNPVGCENDLRPFSSNETVSNIPEASSLTCNEPELSSAANNSEQRHEEDRSESSSLKNSFLNVLRYFYDNAPGY